MPSWLQLVGGHPIRARNARPCFGGSREPIQTYSRLSAAFRRAKHGMGGKRAPG
jgi:hypothetical protein